MNSVWPEYSSPHPPGWFITDTETFNNTGTRHNRTQEVTSHYYEKAQEQQKQPEQLKKARTNIGMGRTNLARKEEDQQRLCTWH